MFSLILQMNETKMLLLLLLLKTLWLLLLYVAHLLLFSLISNIDFDLAGERDRDDQHLHVQDREHHGLHLDHQAGLQEHLLAGVQVRSKECR